MILVSVALLSFGLSFIFALGGMGSASALVPSLMAIGVPGGVARPIGLLVNTISLGFGAVYNIKAGKLKPKQWWLLIAASVPAAPVGTWLSTLISPEALTGIFACFIMFSGVLMILPFSRVTEKNKDKCPPMCSLPLGAASGVVSGMLGVGSGGLIVPVLYVVGFPIHQIAMATSLIVPFASFTGFMAYASMGSINLSILFTAVSAAMVGGIFGAKIMHRIDQQFIKYFLSLAMIVAGAKMFLTLMK